MRSILVAVFFIMGIAVAYAQLAGYSGSKGGPFFNYRDRLGMGLGGFYGPGTPIPPASCSGTVDLSNGCPQPMLGVI